MPEESPNQNQRHFIDNELRPDVGRPAYDVPPVAIGATKEELRSRADEALSSRLRGGNALNHPFLPLAEGVQPTSIIKVNEDVQWTSLEGQAVLLNLGSGYYYTLNRMATVIWEMCAEGETVDLWDVRDAICQRFDVTEEVAIRDIALLMNNLKEEGMIEPVRT
ncbi:MAG: PqqD family protein [Dehalococcoidia bacterium]